MTGYRPTSRRPISRIFRRTAFWPVNLCVCLGIHPNLVSYASIAASAVAGLAFWQASERPWLLTLGVGFCYLRLWLNMFDGMVALSSGKASRWSEIVNELPDRVSDVVIFVGVAHIGLCIPVGGYGVAIMALFVAYVGTLGQAVAGRREGILKRREVIERETIRARSLYNRIEKPGERERDLSDLESVIGSQWC